MPYTDFTLESAESPLGLTASLRVLLPGIQPLPVPLWLNELLDRGRPVAALVSEKARSEFLVAPAPLARGSFLSNDLAIYSWQRLDVDADRGLSGGCDNLSALTEAVPRLRAPLRIVLEAKRGDIEQGLRRCDTQMVATQIFHERSDFVCEVYEAVTTCEVWQFARLDGSALTRHPVRLFIDNLGAILAPRVSLSASKS